MVEATIHCPFCGKDFASLHKDGLADGSLLRLPDHNVIRGVPCPSAGEQFSPVMLVALPHGEAEEPHWML